ncbi:isochorismatase family protein [Endozoicomonas sp. Mp262]|uniref:isochorismatase family protein n=1 Tax=Endozoicomonas sp. Mp262 TaxID=2919499 RepID=UPI0021D9C325
MSIPKITPYTMPEMDYGLNKVQWHPDASRTVLLIHDMQQYFMNFYDTSAEPVTTLVKNIQRIKAQCKAAGIPVIYTAQPGDQNPSDRALLTDFWGTGLKAAPSLTDIIDPLAPEEDDHLLTKWRYSAFKRNGLKARLKEMGRDQMIICGVYAHIGCMLTAADAFMYDIQAFMVSDALADFSKDEHRMALEYVARRCGVTLDSEMVLDSLSPENSEDASSKFMTDIAEILYMTADDLDQDISLMDQGLDSIRVMTLIEQWRFEGIDIDFSELVELTTLTEWLEVLNAKVKG